MIEKPQLRLDENPNPHEEEDLWASPTLMKMNRFLKRNVSQQIEPFRPDSDDPIKEVRPEIIMNSMTKVPSESGSEEEKRLLMSNLSEEGDITSGNVSQSDLSVL